MRSTDERMAEVLGRAKVHETEIRRRRQRAVAFGGGCLSVVAVVLAGVGLSASATDASDAASVAGQLGLMGSVFADGSALGYVVVGLLGLALGTAVTAIAFRLGRPEPEKSVAQLHDAGGATVDSESDARHHP